MGVSWESLGLLEALLGGLKSEKMPTVQRENHFFINTVFWLFEAPNGPLGLILVPFGWIWSQTWVPNGLTSLVKSDQKVVQKMIKKGTPLGVYLGFHFLPKPRSPA